ncbi:methyltransferase domain-containing protein [Candidatus Bathyarchaeota archaeon]|nr:methyltransferase domain-containing protein [Candidatus Bathyarchaeota archaeon]
MDLLFDEINFYKPINQNDVSNVEKIIYPIFTKKNLEDKHHWNKIRELFLVAMENADLNYFIRNIFWIYVNWNITQGIKKRIPLIDVEANLRKFVRGHAAKEKDLETLSAERIDRSFHLVKEYMTGEKVLDLGGGNGRLAQQIKNQLHKEVVLVDVVDYNATDLPLILYNPDGGIPLIDESVDTTLLYTVLHHASDPIHLLSEATRLTRKRLVIVEGYIEEDDKRITNIFFDWFYNRVVGDEDINVPVNFQKVGDWEKILKYFGFGIVETKYLGMCEPLVPEYEMLIIAEK